MDVARLMQWQTLIYLLPGGIAAFLLLVSSLRLGHRGTAHVRGHSGGSHGSHSVGLRAGHAAPTGQSGGPKVQAQVGRVHVTRHGANKENVTVSTNLVLHITGADRVPAALLLEAFFLIWGVCGYWSEEFTIHTADPTFRQMLPSLGIALAGGIVGARLSAELVARLLPQDESQDVSRHSLFGTVGEVVFPVSATSGRIHVYDRHGTLHDETCRLAPGHPEIVRGRTALIVDVDAQGRLLVEEISGPSRETAGSSR